MAEKTTQYVILGFLAQGTPLSGYDIRKWIGLTVGHFWNESFGQLYPELQRLTKSGLVTAVVSTKGKRRRVAYRITTAGRKALAAWLFKPPAAERVRNELLLKVFFGHNAARDILLQHMHTAAARWEAGLEELAAAQRQLVEDDAQSPELVYFIITLRHGRWVRAARLKWAQESAELLQLASKRGNRALIARVTQLEGALP